jgi:putative oxidoreductase
MPEDRLESYGVLLLRLALGTMFIAHSIVYMTMTLGLTGTVEFFASLGLPPPFAYATIVAEALGGMLLILGIQTRWVALALSPILIGAIWVHSGNGWLFAADEGGWEYPLYLFVLCIAQAMLGDGAYALSPSWFPGHDTRASRTHRSEPRRSANVGQ